MKRQICSNDHFKRMLKSFEKITKRVCEDYRDSKSYEDFAYFMGYKGLLDVHDEEGVSFEECINKLFKNFKSNPFKTKSGIICIKYPEQYQRNVYTKFYVSYTFEDEFGKRSKEAKNIIFRLYVKYKNYRKQRLVRWSIPVTWEYLN